MKPGCMSWQSPMCIRTRSLLIDAESALRTHGDTGQDKRKKQCGLINLQSAVSKSRFPRRRLSTIGWVRSCTASAVECKG